MLRVTQRIAYRARLIMRCTDASWNTQRFKSSIAASVACNNFTPSIGDISGKSIGNRHVTGIRKLHVSRPKTGKLVAFTLSDPGEGIREVVIKQWFVKEGDRVSQFAPVCDVESDKATTTITSRYDGVINKLHYAVEQTAIVGSALLDIEIDESESGGDKAQASSEKVSDKASEKVDSAAEQHESRIPDGKALATPAIRRFAAEHKVRLTEVRGSGKNGRIMREDILAFVNDRDKQPASTSTVQVERQSSVEKSAAKSPASSAASLATANGVKLATHSQLLVGSDRTEPLRGGVRKAMFKSMTQSLSVPTFTYMDDIDLTKLLAIVRRLRNQINSSSANASGAGNAPKLTPMAFFIKAVSLALQAYPQLNASVGANEQLVIKAAHNIGVAIDSPSGLIVPNVKHCQLLSVLEIASEIQRLQQAALQGRVAASDLSGGTLTLSNVGVIGGTYTVPIMMPGELLIAGFGRVRDQLLFADSSSEAESRSNAHRARFVDADTGEAIRVRRASIMNVSWSADHRVVDGATVARFSNLWKSYLEAPDSMLISLK